MKKGDLVTRIKYNHDIMFIIDKIEDNIAYLTGYNVRLKADAFLQDLKIYNKDIKEEEIVFIDKRDGKLIPGNILHLDGDEYYLNKCLETYKKYDIPAIGYHMKEKDMPSRITDLLIKHKPDILVITGHDNMKKINGKESFENSKYFINTVKKARIYEPSKDYLVIFAGACQSYYQALIESGANFASSPNRKNINVLDPVYIAMYIAKSHVNNYVDVENILNNTISKTKSLGGIDTKGVARKIYQ